MEQTIIWNHIRAGKNPPKKGPFYIVKGFSIRVGQQVREMRLTRVIDMGHGLNWDSCDDFVVEEYAQITDGIRV